jgi:hypothetical protein
MSKEEVRPILASLIVRFAPGVFTVIFQSPDVSVKLQPHNAYNTKRVQVKGMEGWTIVEYNHPACYRTGTGTSEIYIMGSEEYNYGVCSFTTEEHRARAIKALRMFVKENSVMQALYTPKAPLDLTKQDGDYGEYII